MTADLSLRSQLAVLLMQCFDMRQFCSARVFARKPYRERLERSLKNKVIKRILQGWRRDSAPRFGSSSSNPSDASTLEISRSGERESKRSPQDALLQANPGSPDPSIDFMTQTLGVRLLQRLPRITVVEIVGGQ